MCFHQYVDDREYACGRCRKTEYQLLSSRAENECFESEDNQWSHYTDYTQYKKYFLAFTVSLELIFHDYTSPSLP